jgi:hypothetical protein
LRLFALGTPALEIVHANERFTLTLRLTPDAQRDVLVIEVTLAGDAASVMAQWGALRRCPRRACETAAHLSTRD